MRRFRALPSCCMVPEHPRRHFLRAFRRCQIVRRSRDSWEEKMPRASPPCCSCGALRGCGSARTIPPAQSAIERNRRSVMHMLRRLGAPAACIATHMTAKIVSMRAILPHESFETAKNDSSRQSGAATLNQRAELHRCRRQVLTRPEHGYQFVSRRAVLRGASLAPALRWSCYRHVLRARDPPVHDQITTQARAGHCGLVNRTSLVKLQ